jgi:hypothetical protein
MQTEPEPALLDKLSTVVLELALTNIIYIVPISCLPIGNVKTLQR